MATRVAKVTFGKDLEQKLQPLLANFLNTTLTATTATYDSVDWNSPIGKVELKGRPKFRNGNPATPQNSKSFPTLYFPVCKTKDLKEPLHIFYYFEGDDVLKYMIYEEAKFNTYKKEVPFRHPSGQLHYLIPTDDFVEITQARRRVLLGSSNKIIT
jgi:hypothetical protein